MSVYAIGPNKRLYRYVGGRHEYAKQRGREHTTRVRNNYHGSTGIGAVFSRSMMTDSAGLAEQCLADADFEYWENGGTEEEILTFCFMTDEQFAAQFEVTDSVITEAIADTLTQVNSGSNVWVLDPQYSYAMAAGASGGCCTWERFQAGVDYGLLLASTLSEEVTCTTKKLKVGGWKAKVACAAAAALEAYELASWIDSYSDSMVCQQKNHCGCYATGTIDPACAGLLFITTRRRRNRRERHRRVAWL